MAVKKSELYSTLWRSCDKLRGGMDASQYKDYVLVLLFMKYVSDRSKNAKNSLLEIPEGGGFADLVKLKLHAVGLRGAAHLLPAELSGGMARRVALARAIPPDS